VKRKRSSSSGYAHIYLEKGKYAVQVCRKRYGTYNTIEEALLVRDRVYSEED